MGLGQKDVASNTALLLDTQTDRHQTDAAMLYVFRYGRSQRNKVWTFWDTYISQCKSLVKVNEIDDKQDQAYV